MPVNLTGHLLANYQYIPFDSLLKPQVWSRNDTANYFDSKYIEQENALHFDAVWDNSAKELRLSPMLTIPAMFLEHAYAIEFDIKSVQDRVENDFEGCAVLLGGDSGQRIPFAPPLTTWEPRRILLNGGGKDAKTISIEAKPVGHKLTLWIRNPRILCPKDK